MRWILTCLPTLSNTLEKDNNASGFAWQAKKTGSLEQALQKASGLSRRFVSFLVQNIGWFISCFFFVTGSLFLVSYTADFVRAAIISLILFTYTVMMLIGAYQIRKKRPDLYITTRVLTALGMLLIPLCIAASVRLADFSIFAGAVMTLINMGVFYWLAQLASGITDRSLQGKHPRIFIALTAVQIAVPVLNLFPMLPLLAFSHSVIMLLTAYGLIQFTGSWLKSILVEKNNTAWYAAGTLVYAASISFTHLTLSYGPSLPGGYSGPFIMILAGLLFYVDAQVKKHELEYAFISRLTFGIYALSVFGAAVSFASPLAKIITLVLGACVYGTLVYHYLSIIPMWLFLGSVSWIYYQVILVHVPHQAYFLAAIPGMGCLLWAQKYALKRDAQKLGVLIFRARGILAFVLASYSFWNAEPGIIAFITGMSITGFVYATLRYPFLQKYSGLNLDKKLAVLIETGKDLRDTYLFYGVLLCSLVTLFYAPVMVSSWAVQFGIGLMFLAFIWTYYAAWLYKQKRTVSGIRIAALFNFAVLSIFASLILIQIQAPGLNQTSYQTLFLIPALIAGSILLLWQTIVFRTSFTFYAFLVLSAWAGALIKYTYFPHLSVGMLKMSTALVLFALTWKMAKVKKANELFKEEIQLLAESGPSIKLLGIYPVCFCPLSKLMLKPLNQAVIILWAAALFKIGRYFIIEGFTPAWILNFGLGTFLTLFIIIRFGRFKLIPVPVVMGLLTFVSGIFYVWDLSIHMFGFSAGLYALAITLFSWAGIKRPVSKPVFTLIIDLLNESGQLPDNKKTAKMIHGTAYVIIIASVVLPLFFWLFNPYASILLCMGLAAVFMHLSVRYYNKAGYCYDFLVLAVAGALAAYLHIFSISLPLFLIPDIGAGLLFSLMGLSMAGFKWHSKGIYRKPLERISKILSLTAAFQSIVLVSYEAGFNFMILLTCVVSGAALLVVSHDIKRHRLRLTGILLISFAIFCTGTWLSHPHQLFFLWPIGRGGWISLSVLSFILAVLSAYTRIPALYTIPMRRIGLWFYGISLLKGLEFIFNIQTQTKFEIYIPCFFLILSASGYFFLIRQKFSEYFLPRAVVGTLVTSGILFFYPLFSLSFLLTIFTGILLIIFCIWEPWKEELEHKESSNNPLLAEIGFREFYIKYIKYSTSWKLYRAVSAWVNVMPWLSIAALLVLPVKSLAETVVITGLLAIVTAGLGWKKGGRFMVRLSKLLALVLLHIWPLLFLPAKKGASFTLWQIWPLIVAKFNQIKVLFPWYALELGLIVWGIIGLRMLIKKGLGQRFPILSRLNLKIRLKIRLKVRFLAGLGFIHWAVHLYIAGTNPWMIVSPYALIHGTASLAAAVLMILMGVRQVKNTGKPGWVYAVFFIAGTAGLYLRVLLVGFSPTGIWDTAALLIFSGIAFVFHHMVKSGILSVPLLRMTMLLPLASLFTLPWHLGSGHAGAALLGAGVVYLSLYYTTGRSLFMYMAAAMMNTAVYLWIPLWYESSSLLHLYTVPAAMSVLVLLHLHKKELKRSVLNKARLTTICILYASAGLDVFLRPELFVFILALGFSLAGIIAGIFMQIRAFLYGGLVFMVMNVMGQLLRFYPDGRLEKGIILVTLGAVFMSGMIWFNIKREDILGRIRIFRADLAGWE